MAKKLELIIQSCEGCPYLQYDSYYSMSIDSGYDCNHEKGKRIIDDGDLLVYNKAKEEYQRSLATLFPSSGPELPDPFTIPEWCPLEDV